MDNKQGGPAYEPIVYANGPPRVDQRAIPFQAVVKDRPAFSHIEVYLQPMQKVLANGAAMSWMDGSIQISTNMNECGPAFFRWCAGESVCQNTFTGPGKITFSQDLPGDVLPFAVGPGEGWILSSGSFICGTNNLKVDGQFAGCLACLCSGEGAFLAKITAAPNEQGIFYAGGYGALTRHELADGQTLFIDTGLFFAASDKTKIEIALPGSLATCCWGMEGFVMKFTGPAVVYSQNRNPVIWKNVLRPRPPPRAQHI